MGRVKRLLCLLLLLTAPLYAAPLGEGYEALQRGDLDSCERLFARVEGESGRVARARLAIARGLYEEAAEIVSGNSLSERVTRLEILCRAEDYTEARALLTQLEQDTHSNFPSPYDFQFYLYRGLLELRSYRPNLAEKNFKLALVKARTADQKCQAHDRLTQVGLLEGDLKKASEAYLSTAPLMGDLKDNWVLVEHLDIGSSLNYEKGELATAAAMSQAVRKLYQQNQSPVKAAQSLYDTRKFSDYSNNFEESYQITQRSIKELMQAGADLQAARLLDSYIKLYFNLASKRDRAQFLKELDEAIARLSPGSARLQGEITRLQFFNYFDDLADDVLERARTLKAPDDPNKASQIHQAIAQAYHHKGVHEKAIFHLRQALALAPPSGHKLDQHWLNSRGPILLKLSDVEKSRHQFEAAKKYLAQAIEISSGPDWAFWRVNVRYRGLLLDLQTFDAASARRKFKDALADSEKLLRPVQKASALTLLLSALQLNQSVEDDVIEPADFLLGEYSDMAQDLLEQNFSDPNDIARFLAYFDEWQEEAETKRESLMVAFPLIYKGLFLEALGRLGEARLALTSALEKSKQNQVLQSQMLAQVLLARVAFREDRPMQAVDFLTQASQAARALNPDAARFYLLIAGAAQRDHNQLSKALESFDEALKLKPENPFAALFGRALTLEKMGNYKSALVDLESARKKLQERGRNLSSLRFQAAEARIFSRLNQPDKALKLFAEAHGAFLEKEIVDPLYPLTEDYALCLIELGRKEQALELLTQTLESLQKWQTLTYKEARKLFEMTVTLALELKKDEIALKFLQLSRSAEFLDSVDLSQIPTDDAQTRELLNEVSSLRTQLSKLQEKKPSVEVGQLLATTREKFFLKLSELRETEPDFEALVQLSGSQLSAIQSLLSEQSALIEYFPSQSTLYIFVVTRHEFTLHQVNIARTELEKLVDQHVDSVSDPKRESDWTSRALGSALLGSLKSRLVGMKNLRIVPTGPLWRVAFSSLQDTQGQPLVENFQVSYITSSDLARLRRTGSGPSSRPRRALLVSGADSLPGARSEIENISRLIPDSTVLTDQEVSRRQFIDAVEGKDLIHIASHSRLSTEPSKTYIELGQDRLTLEQIYGLELQPWSLVVLSSCQSAVDHQAPGKEVTSLSSAFSVAGASTVIASRWKIDDRSTQEFFGYFYQALVEGKFRGEAFREAEQKMASKHPHPYYWAGFSLVGDPD